MRGQKLFVRPIEESDAAEVRAFLARNDAPAATPRSGLLGKLVGELVAVLSMEITDRTVRVNGLVVAKELRKKRIGRVMINELESLAGKLEREWIVVDPPEAAGFFERVGFYKDGEQMVLRVKK